MQANLFYSRHEIDEHFHLLTESPHKKRGRMSGGRGEGKESWRGRRGEGGGGDVLVLYAIFESNEYFELNIKIPLADVRSELKRSGRRGKGCTTVRGKLCIFLRFNCSSTQHAVYFLKSLWEKSSTGLAR